MTFMHSSLQKIFWFFGIALVLSVPSYASADKPLQLGDVSLLFPSGDCFMHIMLIDTDKQIACTQIGYPAPKFLMMNIDGVPLKLKQLGKGPTLSEMVGKEGEFYAFHYTGDQVLVDLKLRDMGPCDSSPEYKNSKGCEFEDFLGVMTIKSHQQKSTYKIMVQGES